MPMLGLLLALFIASPSVTPRLDDARALVRDINVQREALGRSALQADTKLRRVALEHALDMARHGFFGHLSFGGISPFIRFSRAHVRFRYGAENLEFDADVTSAEDALWRSQPHRRNALQGVFTRIGVAAVRTSQGEFFVEDFSG